MGEISKGGRLGQSCKLLFAAAPLVGMLSVQQLCPGGSVRLAKPPENGEASVRGHQRPADLREGQDWTAGNLYIHVKDRGGGVS